MTTYDHLGSIVAFEAAARAMEIDQLIHLLIRSELIEKDDAVGFFAKMADIAADLRVAPSMEEARATRIRQYRIMAATIARAS